MYGSGRSRFQQCYFGEIRCCIGSKGIGTIAGPGCMNPVARLLMKPFLHDPLRSFDSCSDSGKLCLPQEMADVYERVWASHQRQARSLLRWVIYTALSKTSSPQPSATGANAMDRESMVCVATRPNAGFRMYKQSLPTRTFMVYTCIEPLKARSVSLPIRNESGSLSLASPTLTARLRIYGVERESLGLRFLKLCSSLQFFGT